MTTMPKRPLRPSANLLTLLDRLKPEEFGARKLVYNQVPHLNDKTKSDAKQATNSKSSVNGVQTLSKKRSCSSEDTSKSTETLLISMKKPKANDTMIVTDCGSNHHSSINSFTSDGNDCDTRIDRENNNTSTDTIIKAEPLDTKTAVISHIRRGVRPRKIKNEGVLKSQRGKAKTKRSIGKLKKETIADELMKTRKRQSDGNYSNTKTDRQNNNTLTDNTIKDWEPFDSVDMKTETRSRKIKNGDVPKTEKGIDKSQTESGISQLNKETVADELMEKRKKQLMYINEFVDISVKYSQFLEKKIATSHPSYQEPSDSRDDRERAIRCLKYFQGTLRPYQIEGVTWLMLLFENSINGILADEMGLDKTIQIVALFSYLYELKLPGPFLIVASLSTLGNWECAFERFAPNIPVVRFQGFAKEKMEQKERILSRFYLEARVVQPVVLCSYQVPLTEGSFLQKFTWQYIVVDEAQRIKNVKGKLSFELRSLKSINRTLLTGTPLQNDITELWSLFSFLMPKLFKDVEYFSSFLELDDVKDKNRLLEAEAVTKLITTIHKVLTPFMLRREKKLVLDEIVNKKEIVVYCPLSEMQKYIYRALLQCDLHKLYMGTYMTEEEKIQNLGKRISKPVKGMRWIQNGPSAPIILVYDSVKPVTVNWGFVPNNHKVPIECPDVAYSVYLTMENISMMMKKTVNHPYLVWRPLDPRSGDRDLFVNKDLIKHSGKLLVLDALLKKLKLGGHKVLIFTTLIMFMGLIEEMLVMRKYKYSRLDPRSTYDDANEKIREFNTDHDVFVFLLSTRAGGLSLNLVTADTVIFMDRDWNPMMDLQIQDRCHPIGQNKPVMIYSLITQGTIDEAILGRGEVKRRLEKVILRGGKSGALKTKIDVDEDGLKELEDLLNREEKAHTVQSDGLLYTDEEFDAILDRSDLFKEMKRRQEKNKRLAL